MTLAHLDNLVKAGKIQTEPASQREFDGMISSAKRRLQDARLESLSDDSRFSLAYGAAHALSLAAMRWHGYRSDNRYLVFQCIEYTVGMETAKWRVLDKCHKQRNLAEYEGSLEITPQLLDELITITNQLSLLVDGLGPVES